METLLTIDKETFLWLNGWVGQYAWVDSIAEVIISDYLVPVVMGLTLLGLWFVGKTEEQRTNNQLAVLNTLASVVLSGLLVELSNYFFYRPRPFENYSVALLFYRPVDSSFPSNPAVVGAAVAMSVFFWNRRIGTVLAIVAFIYSLSRLYGGVCYPLDILGGLVIGSGVSFVTWAIIQYVGFIPRSILRFARALYLA